MEIAGFGAYVGYQKASASNEHNNNNSNEKGKTKKTFPTNKHGFLSCFMFWTKPRGRAGEWITAECSSQSCAPQTLPGAPSSRLPELQLLSCVWAARATLSPEGIPTTGRTDATSHIHSPWHSQAVSPGDSSAVMPLTASAQSTASTAECGQRAGAASAVTAPTF